MPEWTHCIRPSLPQWEGPKDMPFTNPIRRQRVTETPAHVKSFAVTIFFVPNLRVEDAIVPLDRLNAMG